MIAMGPFLLAMAGSRGWRVRDVGDRRRRDVGGHVWKGEAVGSRHPLSASLCAFSWRWREGAVRAGTADGVETASFHDHRYTVMLVQSYARVLESCDP